jgi:hypothetical protein
LVTSTGWRSPRHLGRSDAAPEVRRGPFSGNALGGMSPMASRPTTLRLARILVSVDSLLWLAFAAFTAMGAHPSFGPISGYRWPVALLALLVAALLGGLSVHLRNPTPLGYWLGVGLLAAMILASFFDQFGLADLIFVAAMALPLLLLVKDRDWYLRPGNIGGRDRGAAQ